MRRLINAASCAILIALSLPPAVLTAQGIRIPTDRLQSPVDSVRINTFYQLQAAAYDARRQPDLRRTNFLAESAKGQPALAAALIRLLERENARIASAPAGSLSADYLGDYYLDLKTTVGRIGDPSSVGALLGGMEGSGPADSALASFGDVAVPGLLAHFHSTDPARHASAVGTLVGSLERRTQNHLSDSSAARIQRALLDEILDPKASSREFAIEGLASMNNQEVRSVMEHVAATDSAASRHDPGQPIRYGVREAAKAWLAKHPTAP